MTIGWIREDALDAFYENTWPGHIEPVVIVDRACPFCHERLADFADLNAHLHSRHVVRRPFLLLSGREPGGEDARHWPIPPDQVEAFEVDAIEIAIGHEPRRRVDLSELSVALNREGARTIQVGLFARGPGGEEVSSRYRLEVRIAPAADLEHADRVFVEMFGRGEARLL